MRLVVSRESRLVRQIALQDAAHPVLVLGRGKARIFGRQESAPDRRKNGLFQSIQALIGVAVDQDMDGFGIDGRGRREGLERFSGASESRNGAATPLKKR
jgi:hypothetical protein